MAFSEKLNFTTKNYYTYLYCILHASIIKPETGKKKESKLLIRNCLLKMQKILSKILSIRPTKGLVSLDKILAFLTNFWPKNENCFLQNQNKLENQHLILRDLTFTKNILHTSTLQIHMRHVCTMYMYCKPTYVIIPVITLLYLLNTRQTTKKVDDNTMIQLYYCWKTLKKNKNKPQRIYVQLHTYQSNTSQVI